MKQKTKQPDEWAFFRTDAGRISFHPQCLRCVHTCKQSWRVKALRCMRYQKAR